MRNTCRVILINIGLVLGQQTACGKLSGAINKRLTLQEVYQCIFGNPEGELATVTDKMKRMEATCKAFSKSNTCEGETWIEDMTSNELPYADWPYSLREANMPYSVNHFWRDCEWKDEENQEEEKDWAQCLNRTHMANWMEWRLMNKETNKLSEEVNILTRTEDSAVEKNMFGTTLMAMCFYRLGYNSQKFENAEPYFRDLCLKEFEYSCKEENLERHPINLYFCDKVSDERLKRFLKKVRGETFRQNMLQSIKAQ